MLNQHKNIKLWIGVASLGVIMSLLQLHVRVAVLVLLVSETRQFGSVSSSHFGTFDFAELENAAYEVDIASTPMSELQFEVSECVCVCVGVCVYVCVCVCVCECVRVQREGCFKDYIESRLDLKRHVS